MKLCITLLILLTSLLAETEVSGIILQNEWWSRDKSPYILTNDLIIGPDARLVIEPGVEILVEKPLKIPEGIPQLSKADTFSISIRVHGALRCMGKPDQPIIFRGRYVKPGDEYTHWEGITIKSNRSDEIFIGFTHIMNSAVGLTISRGSSFIRNSLFLKNSVGTRIENAASPQIFNSLYTDNFLCAIRVDSANPKIYNSIFYENRNIALWSDYVSKVTFEFNGLYSNGDNNFVNANPEFGAIAETNKNGDSTDLYGNLFNNPLFIGTSAETGERDRRRKELYEQSLKEPTKQQLNEIDGAQLLAEGRRYFLSKFSTYINAGNTASDFREPDGSLPDLGIWGGPEFLDNK